jgi:hypothetical protein
MESRGMKLIALLLAAASLGCAADRVIFTKSFPGSKPAYVQITIERDGSAVYKEDPKDENPVTFKLTEAETNTFFDLADRLGHFSKPLESGLKIANMGKKTFRWEGASTAKEQSFNFSEIPEAKELLDWFEKISQTEQNFIELEFAVRFDKLGVNMAVLHLEMTRDQKKLMAAAQFLPLLDKVTGNENIMHMARSRAAALAEGIRAGK